MAAGVPTSYAPPPIPTPFATADHVEGAAIEAVDLGGPATPPDRISFLDGIQRFAVEGRIGLVPVVRGYVAAAALRRESGVLHVADVEAEEFLVVPLRQLTDEQRQALGSAGLPMHEPVGGERAHPIVDVQLAAQAVEERREAVELRVARRHLATSPDEWLVVDGSIAGLSEASTAESKVLGVIKSHETQFLAGRDLDVALTLPVGHRTSVFARGGGARARVFTWYLRLWPWEEHDLLHGLVRIECPATTGALAEATSVSRWLLAERAPLSAPDGRWDRLLYPVRQVETYLRANAGGWW